MLGVMARRARATAALNTKPQPAIIDGLSLNKWTAAEEDFLGMHDLDVWEEQAGYDSVIATVYPEAP